MKCPCSHVQGLDSREKHVSACACRDVHAKFTRRQTSFLPCARVRVETLPPQPQNPKPLHLAWLVRVVRGQSPKRPRKWPNFRWWLEGQGGASAVAAKYDYIWVVDDDVRLPTHEIAKMFDILREHSKIEVACPSFDKGSDGVWRFFDGHDPRFKLRFTNFVECTAPILKSTMLQNPRFQPCLRAVRTGCFIDFCFHPAAGGGADVVAVIDAVQCHHPPRTADHPSEMRQVQAWHDHKNDDVLFEKEGVPKEWWSIEPRARCHSSDTIVGIISHARSSFPKAPAPRGLSLSWRHPSLAQDSQDLDESSQAETEEVGGLDDVGRADERAPWLPVLLQPVMLLVRAGADVTLPREAVSWTASEAFFSLVRSIRGGYKPLEFRVDHDGKESGVFSGSDITQGDLVEVCPLHEVPAKLRAISPVLQRITANVAIADLGSSGLQS
ncbi:unnamed protein product [Symbiodinium microadriaticum]|nr:unnamed protein product [Symbiodinium microadriaticum]CAE7945299.1 unnamed protein product [Symbiodinium sp. KB8]